MKKDRILFDFIKIPVAEKIGFARNVVHQMNNNEAFASLQYCTDDLKSKTDVLESSYITSMIGSREATLLLREATSVWKDVMREVATRVELLAKGDGAVLLGAGFNLAKQQGPSSRPLLTAKHGEKSGSVSLRRKAQREARAYVWQMCAGEYPADEKAWTVAAITTQASTELNDLTSMTKYWFRSATVTRDGTSEYCQPVMLIVI